MPAPVSPIATPILSDHPPFARPLRLESAGRTEAGAARWKNEDALLLMERPGVFAVADGMIGATAGDIASTMLVANLREVFDDGESTLPPGVGAESRDPAVLMYVALQRANRRIRNAGFHDPKKSGMGSSFAGIAFGGGQVVLAQVGDSRIYRLRGGRLERLATAPSSQAAPRAGLFGGPPRAVGLTDSLVVDPRREPVVPGDLYLLSTDGLHETVPHEDIAAILLGEEHLPAAVDLLAARARLLGGPDNVTVVLVRASLA